MDQAELDAAYDQSVYAPNLQQIVKRWAANSDGVRARLGAPQLLVGEGYNHFEIIETLGNPYGLLGRAVVEQMQLAKI